MQSEDDLRGLAKVMDFMRAISIMLVLVHIYWYCHAYFVSMNYTVSVVDKILLNFQDNTGLFNHTIITKFFVVLFLALSCLGTKGVKNQKVTWGKITLFLFLGILFFFINWWILDLMLSLSSKAILYTFTMSLGYLFLLLSGVWISRLIKINLMDDVFNIENESFMQEMQLMDNEYSVNLPTSFWYRKKQYNGWINVVNPFRATIVLGTPGSGKSYAVINN
ncbi:MAG: YWFCY domain-containing protein, partial [Dysgonamonadaceae bacterium]